MNEFEQVEQVEAEVHEEHSTGQVKHVLLLG